jgi:hypothetical protein
MARRADADAWGDPGAVTSQNNGWVDIDFPAAGLVVSVKTATVDGLPAVVGLHVEAWAAGQPSPASPIELPDAVADLLQAMQEYREGPWQPVAISARRLRALPLGQVRETALHHPPRTFAGAPGWGRPSSGPQPVPTAKLEQAADVYRRAVDDERDPIPAICSAFGVKRATASKYVRLARDHNPPLLGWPAQEGRPGYKSQVSPRALSAERRRANVQRVAAARPAG